MNAKSIQKYSDRFTNAFNSNKIIVNRILGNDYCSLSSSFFFLKQKLTHILKYPWNSLYAITVNTNIRYI